MKKLSLIVIVGVLMQLSLSGQKVFPEVLSSTGGTAKNSNIDLTFTIGEPFYETVTNTSSVLTQGFNQISKATDTNELQISDFMMVAYPNPTSSVLFLKTQSDKFNGFDLFLMDIQGRLLLFKAVKNNLETINMGEFAAGIYFLKLMDKGKLVKTVKIQKINEQ